MACAIPTEYPQVSDCVSGVLAALRGGPKSKTTIQQGLVAASYFVGFLPDGLLDNATDDGVLKATAPMTVEEAISFLEAQQANHDQGVQQAFDLTRLMQIVAFLQQLAEILKGLKK